MQLGEMVYGAVARASVPALRLVAPLSAKLQRGVRGRAAALDAMHAWGASARDPARPLVWLHAPSVGEALMAQAILHALRAARTDIQSVFTHFSPSAERIAPRVGADWAGYLPWDRAPEIDRALAAVQPACVAFVRTEIWPTLLRRAQARGARVALVNAVLSDGSTRARFPARALLRHAYRSLDAVGAVSPDDAARLPLLGVDPRRIHVTGDARYDQVWNRITGTGPGREAAANIRSMAGPWLVAGSTWPADEDVLIQAICEVRARGVPVRCVCAPHEPTPPHLAVLEDRLTRANLAHARLPEDAASTVPDVDVLVVDRVGVLADLYAAADVAYVGGGFGTAGLHSVIEPAALGVPVLYGPRHGSAREAARLEEAGGGFAVHDAVTLTAIMVELLRFDDVRQRASRAARAYAESQRGGAAANAALILGLL